MDLKPRIAVIDSGIGGTGVFAELRNLAPFADLVYVADQAYGPYGERSLAEVRMRTEMLARYLTSAGVDVVVIACNSASAAALHHLRSVLPATRFVGMEPAVKPAVERTSTGVIGVMATGATFQGELFKDLVGRHGDEVRIVEQACPGLAAAIERGADVGDLLDRYLAPMIDQGADVIVLGCTHYPLILDEIAMRLPAGVTMIDPAAAVARRAVEVSRDADVDLLGSGATWWWTTRRDLRDVRKPSEIRDDWEAIDVDAAALAALRIGEATLAVVRRDITTMHVDVITNAANTSLVHGGGVAAAIRRAGGPIIDEESRAWIAAYGPLEPGVAALTSAGEMPSSYVVHVAGPVFRPGQDNAERLAAAVLATLDLGTEIGATSIAIPAISAGVYGYPPDEATAVIAETAAEYLSDTPSKLRSVILVALDLPMAERFATALGALVIEP